MKEPLRIFVGYDKREHDAWLVCRESLLRHSSIPLCIQALNIDALTRAGLYRRSYRQDGAQKYDLIDGKPFSTEFSFSRFLVPALCQYEGVALFVDCDFLFRADVASLLADVSPNNAVSVVHHDYMPGKGVKMDGQRQENYQRKNWSSLMVMNCGHPSSRALTGATVSEADGAWLHQFRWCRPYEIGEVDRRWNWLEGWHDPADEPAAVHYTRGVPSMPGYEDAPFADEWRLSLARAEAAKALEAAA